MYDRSPNLPPPTSCPQCGNKDILLTTNAKAFGANAARPDKRIYHCPHCRASVGVHEGTDSPMGYMASPKIRALRSTAHVAFDTVWKYSRVSRDRAYRLLSEELGIPYDQCHIGLLSADDLRRVIAFAEHYHSAEAAIEHRRKAKKHERAIKRADRESVRTTRAREDDFQRFKRDKKIQQRSRRR